MVFVISVLMKTELSTPGPRIMRIHLVRYSTSARSGKNPQIFIYCKFIQLVRTIHLVRKFALSK